MRQLFYVTFITTLLLNINYLKAFEINESVRVIHGNDDRYEAKNFPDARFREYALSVAALVNTDYLLSSEDDRYFFLANKTEINLPGMRPMPLCPEERFSMQRTIATCTGFLIGPKTLLTAGHCINDTNGVEAFCKEFKWVFGYTSDVDKIDKKRVYSCKEVVKNKTETGLQTFDYAVVKLDRPVVGVRPLRYRKIGFALAGTRLIVIGHPSGLPLKIIDNATIKTLNDDEFLTPFTSMLKRRYYFITNLDTYRGNSGSPVFNVRTGLVEGIFIEGAIDYVPELLDRDLATWCLSTVNKTNSFRESEEKVFRITKLRL